MKNSLLIIVSFVFSLTACNSEFKQERKKETKEKFTVVFYNVENLFDTIHEEGKVDKEFMPNSKKAWNTERYNHKLQQLALVIDSIGEQSLPDIVALEEVENMTVLQDLVKQKSISDADYKIIHYESPDFRGIDNAFLYNASTFTPIYQRAIPVNMPDSIGEKKITTRDILYVKGLVYGRDTLHVFVNHWTSMYYGKEITIPYRKFCASILKAQIDSIMSIHPNANILAGGDLNENVFAPAVSGVMMPDTLYNQAKADRLYNLSHYLFTAKGQGTYNYKGEWGVLDHMMVSGNLLNTSNEFYTTIDDAHVFNSMLVMNKYNNKNGKGIRPNRSYGGNNYYGGFSDHLPVYIHFTINH